MKNLTLTATALMMATPALAHEGGAHVHPHGYEALLVLALCALGIYAIVKR